MFKDESIATTGYAYIRLDETRFEKGVDSHADALAANPSLTMAMQQRLFGLKDPAIASAIAANPSVEIADALMATNDAEVLCALAANPAVEPAQLEILAETGTCGASLAANPSAPAHLLERLYDGGDTDVLGALAANPSTPVAILQQLQLDSRFERAVRSNEAFGRYIQRENIGWL